jgi:hypothetical protein
LAQAKRVPSVAVVATGSLTGLTWFLVKIRLLNGRVNFVFEASSPPGEFKLPLKRLSECRSWAALVIICSAICSVDVMQILRRASVSRLSLLAPEDAGEDRLGQFLGNDECNAAS